MSRSPLSENTIQQLVENDEFIRDAELNYLSSSSSDSEEDNTPNHDYSSTSNIDDSDLDPTFDPDRPDSDVQRGFLKRPPHYATDGFWYCQFGQANTVWT
ncbi:hypothetical protein LSTR_LSTR006456 [Laodelphax striatellus]|uniref:Uncharacterized protein n=1 Tax=Laodelphax striatellus TaxID=195883 RepID=A0A482WWT7_LAOST|nr:hypothetical protein LSTR_LSTR006456 [Laodelphax striatellus]